MKNIFIILLFPFVSLSQDVDIRPMPDNINTIDAELNFTQINDSTAYFTVVSERNSKLESNIYSTSFIDGSWSKKKYTDYNSDFFNTANITFLDTTKTFITRCNQDMLDCQIVYLDNSSIIGFSDIPPLLSDQFFNTQASICKNNLQTALYFVSNRNGGFGGLDIWLSTIDNDGNFGVPINAGNNINTIADEITPFYNIHDKMLYFSSNKKGGIGGFDIYKSEGNLNLWGEAINAKKMNTLHDEMYLNFYNENSGYFSSNRKGAKFKSSEYCCNDIFSFNYLESNQDVTKDISSTHSYLPLDLYFHNDEPDCCTMNTTTNITYKEAYVSYFMMKSDYEKYNLELNNFFENVLQSNFTLLNKLLNALLLDLSISNSVELKIRGFASPLHGFDYNQNLSQRRISSVINYINKFKNGIFKRYILSEQLIVTELPFGESNSSKQVSDDASDKQKSIYSIEAMLERKIEIVDVILK